ncbi:hypothetical protein BMS3Abin02_00854 [bacterium BMS3Abin02]|nr:hypothetical protein BMS3Abin02_00854 [bacterium BMS3Abin02]
MHVVSAPAGRGFARQHTCTKSETGCACFDAEAFDHLDEFERRPHGTFRVILLCRRGTPHRHDGIADELVHLPAKSCDDLTGTVEVDREEFTDLFCVPFLGERCEADEVGEENRYESSFRGLSGPWFGNRRCGRRTGQRGAAFAAELLGVRVRRAARRAIVGKTGTAVTAELLVWRILEATIGAVHRYLVGQSGRVERGLKSGSRSTLNGSVPYTRVDLTDRQSRDGLLE